jgi:hypothetical protein
MADEHAADEDAEHTADPPPEDENTADKGASDQDAGAKDPSGKDTEQDRIDDLEGEIDAARRQAEDHGLIPSPDEHPQRFADSGDEQSKELDDQSIAP